MDVTIVGRRVRLISTTDPHTSLKPGAIGRVGHVDFIGTVHVNWDGGSRLGLVPDVDEYELLPEEPAPG